MSKHDIKVARPGYVDTFHQAGIAHTSKDIEAYVKDVWCCVNCGKKFAYLGEFNDPTVNNDNSCKGKSDGN